MLQLVVPFLLHTGIASPAEDVKAFSMRALHDIYKSAGKILAPHVSDLVTVLLENMSSLEPQVVNYLSFHIEKYNIAQEQVRNVFFEHLFFKV